MNWKQELEEKKETQTINHYTTGWNDALEDVVPLIEKVYEEGKERAMRSKYVKNKLKEAVEEERERILDICWRHCGTDASDNLEQAIKAEALSQPNNK
jgi:hypothetical protein